MSKGASEPTVTPLAGALGVRIDGIDLAREMSAHLVDALQVILDRHLVIHLPRQQDLSSARLHELVASWGEIVVPSDVPSVHGHPGIVKLADTTGTRDATTRWRHDRAYTECPPAVAFLMAREVPRCSGDMMWANQYDAWDGLTPGLRDMLDGMYAVHEETDHAEEAWPDLSDRVAVHPVAPTHDRTGRRALFVDARFTTRFDGWSAEESAPLLDYLHRVAVRDELTCRHRWAAGDLVIWDARATLHCTVGDGAPGSTRVFHRASIAGDVPH